MDSFALPVIGQPSRSVPREFLSHLSADDAALALQPLGELFANFPGAPRALFLKFHLGGCGSCAMPPGDSLALLCQRNGFDVALAVQCVRLSAEFDACSRVTPKELAELLAQGSRLRLLDARSREEWIAARIKGAIHLENQKVKGILQSWPRHVEMVIYDHRGADSAITADYFIAHGFKNVRWLDGGIDAWSLQVDPTVRRYRLERPAPAPGVPESHSKAFL